jgi:Transposase DDE domain group 1
VDLAGWPEGMRVIIRKERPHPGAQLRFTDVDGHRFTCSATSARRGQLADLELRHRRRARCEDRNAKDTGLRNLPLDGFDQNQIWCDLVAMACELSAWMQMLALDGPAPRLGIQTAAAATPSAEQIKDRETSRLGGHRRSATSMASGTRSSNENHNSFWPRGRREAPHRADRALGTACCCSPSTATSKILLR